MISGLFSCSEKAIETDLYGTRSDIRNGRHSGPQIYEMVVILVGNSGRYRPKAK